MYESEYTEKHKNTQTETQTDTQTDKQTLVTSEPDLVPVKSTGESD